MLAVGRLLLTVFVCFVFLAGNPGLAGYYRTFIQALYCGLNQQYPVWVVSHAGHCKPPSGMEMIEGTILQPVHAIVCSLPVSVAKLVLIENRLK